MRVHNYACMQKCIGLAPRPSLHQTTHVCYGVLHETQSVNQHHQLKLHECLHFLIVILTCSYIKAHSLYSSGGTYLHNTSLTTCQFILHFLHRNLIITTLVQPCMYHCTVHSRLQHIAVSYACTTQIQLLLLSTHFSKNRVPVFSKWKIKGALLSNLSCQNSKRQTTIFLANLPWTPKG